MFKGLIFIFSILIISHHSLAEDCTKALIQSKSSNILKPLSLLNLKLHNHLQKKYPTTNLDDLQNVLIALKAEEQRHNNSYTNKHNQPRYLDKAQAKFIIKNNASTFKSLGQSDIEDVTLFYMARLRRLFLETVKNYKFAFISKNITLLNLQEVSPSEISMLSEYLETFNKDIHRLSEKSLSLEDTIKMLSHFKFYTVKQFKGLLIAFTAYQKGQQFELQPTQFLLEAGFEWPDLSGIRSAFKNEAPEAIKDLKCCGMSCRDCTFGFRWLKQ